MRMSPPVFWAESVTTGFGLARAQALFLYSTPWSIELRTRCIIGSEMLSTIVLSTSVSSPMSTKLCFLVEVFAHVADDAVHFLEDRRNRHHAD